MKYFLFMIAILGSVSLIAFMIIGGHDDEHPALNDSTLKTDYLLKYAKEDLSKHYYETSLYHIEKAIEVMQLMERDVDSESDRAIETAIKDLRQIEKKILSNQLSYEEVNFVFAKALNSVAYAHLRLSEEFSEEGKHEEAANALKLSINHLENSMLFSTGKYKNLEYNVFLEIDSLIKLEETNPEKFMTMVKDVILEVDTALLNKEYNEVMMKNPVEVKEEKHQKEKHSSGHH